MKLYEYLASVILDVIDLHTQGKSVRYCFDILGKAQKWLPYDAQLDVYKSGPDKLSFVANVPHNNAPQPSLVVVRPTFLGLYIAVVDVENDELSQCVAMDFSVALNKEVGNAALTPPVISGDVARFASGQYMEM